MTTADAFLGGRLTLQQPVKGFRAGLDSVMLAAAVPAVTGETVLELGSGAGAAALCLARRVFGVRVLGLEIQADLVALASANTEHNKLIEWVLFLNAAVEAPPEGMMPGTFDHVMMNPPFFVAGTDDAPPGLARATAHIADPEALARWTKCARTYLKPKGRLTAILPAQRLPDMLAALEKGFGGIEIFPLWPRAGEPAKRVILTARLGSRTPLELKPGLVLHAPDAKYTPEAEAILRDGAALALS